MGKLVPEPNLPVGPKRVILDSRTYRLAAIKKAAYRVAALCTAVLEHADDDRIAVTFMFKPITSEAAASEAVRAFYQELLDQELREHVAEETTPLRMLILAQAFSRTDLIERG
jgi:His-Xaa-Ser system protein HxsD